MSHFAPQFVSIARLGLATVLCLGMASSFVHAQIPIMNGDFSDPTGAPWVFMDQSQDGSVDYSAQNAVVAGGDDGYSGMTTTAIEQAFSVGSASMETIMFTWSYTTIDPCPGFDAAFWDLIDTSTGASVVNGPITLADISGTSGVVMTVFTGSGDYLLRLGTTSVDNDYGPGVSTFDDVFVSGTTGTQLIRGDCNDDGSTNLSDVIFLLGFLFPTGGPTPTLVCLDACDANDDGGLNLPDAVTLLLALFGTPPTPLPGPLVCDMDPTMDPLDCMMFSSCP